MGIFRRAVLSVLQYPTGKISLSRVQKLAAISGKVASRIDQIDIEFEPGIEAEDFRRDHENDLPPQVTFAGTASQTLHVKRDLQGMKLVQFLITALVFASAIFIILTSLTTAGGLLSFV